MGRGRSSSTRTPACPSGRCRCSTWTPRRGNRDKTVVVKLISAHQPVPPANKSNLPITPVTFEGLSITPWVDDNGQRPRLMYSIRATGFADEAPTAERKAA